MFGFITKRLTPMTRRRLDVFWRQPRSKIGIFFMLLVIAVTGSAELISNDKPFYVSRNVTIMDNLTQDQLDEMEDEEFAKLPKERRSFYPLFKDYTPYDFGLRDAFVVDYKELAEQDKEDGLDTSFIWTLHPWGPSETVDSNLPPSNEHPLGTDMSGQDVLSNLIYGTRTAILFALCTWALATFCAIVIGGIQGFYGGWLDFSIERYQELNSAIPSLFVAILASSVFDFRGFFPMVIIFSLWAGWIFPSEFIRSQFLQLRKKEFCEAAISLGASNGRVMFKHILPNAITPLLVTSPFTISGYITLLTILDFLGYGMPSEDPSLGALLRQGQALIQEAPWLVLGPSFVLFGTILSINLIGQGLREAFDPRAG